MTLKDALILAISTAREVQAEMGFMFSSEAIVSLSQTVFNNALKDIRTETINGNGKGTYKQPGQTAGKLATEKQISLLQKIDKENGGAIMKDLLAKGIKTTDGLTMAIASELITKFGKGSGKPVEKKTTATTPIPASKETPRRETTESTDEKASDKQIKFLYYLANKLGHSGQVQNYLKEYFKVTQLNEVTKSQAKSGIASLQRQIN